MEGVKFNKKCMVDTNLPPVRTDLADQMDPERPSTTQSNIQTLEPYLGGKRASKRARVSIPVGERTSSRVPTYLDLKFDKKIDSLSCFAINREIDQICGGKPKKISQVRDDTLLIEVCRPDQAKKLLNDIKKIAGAGMSISANKHLNHVKGVVYSRHLMNYTEDVLCKELGDQGVTEVQRIKKKEGSDLVDTPLLILTLDLEKLPDKIMAAWHVLEVRPYVPTPRRCFQCQKFGHLGKWCRSEIAICVQCGESKLAEHKCNKTKCANCKQSHPASDKNCEIYKRERQVLELKTQQKISYKQAKKEVDRNHGPTPGGSYVKATKTTPPPQNNQKVNQGAKPKEQVQQADDPRAPGALLHTEPAPKEQRLKFAQIGQKTETALGEQQVKSAQSGQTTKAVDDTQQRLEKAVEGDRQAKAALKEQQPTAAPEGPPTKVVPKESYAKTAQVGQQDIPAQKGQPAKSAQSGQAAKPDPVWNKAMPASVKLALQAKHDADRTGATSKHQTGAGRRRALSDVSPRSPNQRKNSITKGIVPPPIRKTSNLQPTPSTKVGQSWQTDQPPTSKAQEKSKLLKLSKGRSSLPSVPPVVKALPLGASTPKHGEEPEDPDMDTTIVFDEVSESGSKRKRDSESSEKAPEEGEGKRPSSKKSTA